MTLQMPDERVVPVDDIQRAIWTDAGVDRAEIRVLRLHNVLFPRPFDPGAIVREIDPVDPLKPDHVGVDIVAPILVRKMRAGENRAARRGARGTFPELLQFRMLHRIIQLSAESRPEVSRVTRRIRDEVVAPIIESAAVRIRETVRNIRLKLPR